MVLFVTIGEFCLFSNFIKIDSCVPFCLAFSSNLVFWGLILIIACIRSFLSLWNCKLTFSPNVGNFSHYFFKYIFLSHSSFGRSVALGYTLDIFLYVTETLLPRVDFFDISSNSLTSNSPLCSHIHLLTILFLIL